MREGRRGAGIRVMVRVVVRVVVGVKVVGRRGLTPLYSRVWWRGRRGAATPAPILVHPPPPAPPSPRVIVRVVGVVVVPIRG